VVLSQSKNDVTVEDLVSGKQYVFFVADLRIFVGTKEEALAAARLDDDQYVIDRIVTYRGDPDVRTTMEFLVMFEDSSEHWLPWSEDLSTTSQFESYCLSIPHLRSLRYTTAALGKINSALNRSPISEVQVGDIVFVDLRSYGHLWFDGLNLPDTRTKSYVVQYRYIKTNHSKSVMWAVCDVFNEQWKLNHVFVLDYGSTKVFDPRAMILIDTNFVETFPAVLSPILEFF
jgi:hypothetical protein